MDSKPAKKSNQHIENTAFDILVHLAKRDSQHVRNQLIVPWANSTDYKERLLAARILRGMAIDEDFIHTVFTLTKSWIRQHNNERLQWTALGVLGSKVGGAYYSQSLELLKEMYESANVKRLFFPLQRSFEQLCRFAEQSKEHEELFFSFWTNWFKHSDEKQLGNYYSLPIPFFNRNTGYF
ncbi:hypothetical protein ACI2OX_04720 [Bacillus sp. N9]